MLPPLVSESTKQTDFICPEGKVFGSMPLHSTTRAVCVLVTGENAGVNFGV